MSDFQIHKRLVLDFFSEMEKASTKDVADVLCRYTSEDYRCFGVHPFNELEGAATVSREIWAWFKTGYHFKPGITLKL